jgi:hypothetical protein
MHQYFSRRHLRFASVRAYIAATDLEFWQKAIREAERELDAATTRSARHPKPEPQEQSSGTFVTRLPAIGSD